MSYDPNETYHFIRPPLYTLTRIERQAELTPSYGGPTRKLLVIIEQEKEDDDDLLALLFQKIFNCKTESVSYDRIVLMRLGVN